MVEGWKFRTDRLSLVLCSIGNIFLRDVNNSHSIFKNLISHALLIFVILLWPPTLLIGAKDHSASTPNSHLCG